MKECSFLETLNTTKLCMKTIGGNIKRLRCENELSQFDLACLDDCDKSIISELERGVYQNISIKTLIKFAYIFEVDIINLIR